MIRRLTVVALLAASLSLVQNGFETASSRPLRVLIVKPSAAHLGDLLFISGSGFPAHETRIFTIACPNIAYQYPGTGIETIQGPLTDRNGTFTKFAFRFNPAAEIKSPLNCSIYTNDGVNYLGGADIPGFYTVYPTGARLPHCSMTMCVHIHLSEKRIKPGSTEDITITNGWGGAIADVTVSYSGTVEHQRQELDVIGGARFSFQIPGQLARTLPTISAHVQVRVRLGNVAGRASGTFIIARRMA